MNRTLSLGIAVLLWLALSGCAYYHVIQPGDTLYGLSKEYGVSVQEIQRNNPGVDPYNLEIGQQVKIPRLPNQKVADYAGRTDTKPAAKKPEKKAAEPKKNPPPEATPQPKVDKPKKEEIQPKEPPRSTATVNTEKLQFIWPVQGGQVLERFGETTDDVAAHGVEIGAPEGTAVVAVADGKVILSSDEFKGYGNMVVVRHENNFFSIYACNKKNLVKKGDTVRQGQKIAEVGQTGRAAQPLLQFQVRIGSKAVDPMKYLPKR